MRLLNVNDLSFSEFSDESRPKYVIASHRWSNEEITFKDVVKGRYKENAGYKKVEAFAKYVRDHVSDIDWLWIDTCCIKKTDAVELSYAINSMFDWYRNAELCIAYLGDVETGDGENTFEKSEWFSRGWTLQELLAPRVVIFLTKEWRVIGNKGSTFNPCTLTFTGPDLIKDIARITELPEDLLNDWEQSTDISIDEKLTWMDKRRTTREEDIWYALFGVIGVSPGVNYGEKFEAARQRLLAAVQQRDMATAVDLSKLFKVSEATYDSRLEAKLSTCLDGTRSKILDDITHWAEKNDSKTILWLCGQAGTGKLTISRTVAGRLDLQGRLGASFFFKRGERNRGNADYFFPTITAQLADKIPQLRRGIAAALEQDSMLCHRGIRTQFEKLLLEPLKRIDSGHWAQERVVVVIDALDECDRDTDIRMFLKLLGQIKSRSHLNLQIFLTSRPELPVRLGFQQLDGTLHEDVLLEEIQSATISEDIRTFINHELAEIRNEHRLSSNWPSEEDLQTLVSLAIPLFIFAKTVCRFVAESNPKKRLQLVLEQQYFAGASHMAGLYLPILDQLLTEKLEEEQQETLSKFREVIGPIVLVTEPLSVLSLSTLLGLDADDIGDVLRRLHSILQVPEDLHQPVRLLHLSFRDFLLDPRRISRYDFCVDEINTHRWLALGCLRQMTGVLKNDICNVTAPGCRRIEVSAQDIAAKIPTVIAYACCYWPLHVLESGEPLLDHGLFHYFLRHHLLHWFEALSWLGKLSVAIAYLNELSVIAQGNEVSDLLQDAKRFLIRNHYVIDLAPLQVYHSAMIFAPTDSILRRIFDSSLPRIWNSTARAPQSWDAERLRLEGHTGPVFDVVFSPDRQIIASGSLDRTVRLWDALTGEALRTFEGHNDKVFAVAFSPDKQLLASASADKTVRLWDIATGEELYQITGHTDAVNAVAFSPDGNIIGSASSDLTARLWDVGRGEQIVRLSGHTGQVLAVAFSPDGRMVASASRGWSIRLWSMKGECLHTCHGHEGEVGKVIFSPDSRFIASASSDMTIRIWKTTTGEQTHKLAGHNSEVNSIAFSLDGLSIASTSYDRTVRVWDSATGKEIHKSEGDWMFTAINFLPDNQIVVVELLRGVVRLWNIMVGISTQRREGHDFQVSAVGFLSNGEIIASYSQDSIRIWSSTTGKHTGILQTYGENIRAVAFSADGRILAAVSIFHTVRLWNMATCEPWHVLGAATVVRNPKLGSSPDSKAMAIYTRPQASKAAALVRDAKLVFSPDSKAIVLASPSARGVRILNTVTGDQTQRFEAWIHEVDDIVFSPSGRIIAWTSRASNELLLWNLATGIQILGLRIYNIVVFVLAFSPDEKIVASSSDDRMVRLWDVATGVEIGELKGDNDRLTAVAFSPDGKVIATASEDRTIRLWNIATCEIIQTIDDVNKTTRILFSANGRYLHTDCGTFILGSTTAESSHSIAARTTSLELRGQWVRYQNKDLLWLPYEYRDGVSAVHGKSLVIGQESGAVNIFSLK